MEPLLFLLVGLIIVVGFVLEFAVYKPTKHGRRLFAGILLAYLGILGLFYWLQS